MTAIVIPKLGASMLEGTLQEWLKPDGSTVTAGEPLFIVETDKVEQEIEAPASGTLRHMAEAGSLLDVGAQIGEIT